MLTLVLLSLSALTMMSTCVTLCLGGRARPTQRGRLAPMTINAGE
jgi:hypothetical protein